MTTLMQNLKYGLRMLIRAPGFTVLAVLSLGLGVGATAVLFSILDGAYIHFAPTPQGNRVAVLSQQFTQRESETWLFSPAEYFDIASFHQSFDGFFAVSHSIPTLTEGTEHSTNPERVAVVHNTAGMFRLYGIPPLLGRLFTADEDQPGGPNVAVVTYRLWNRRFARNPAIVGKTIKLDGLPYTVIGVTPRRFQEWGADIFVPLQLDRASTSRSVRTLTVAGVVKEGLSAEQTAPALRDLARRVEVQYRATNPDYDGLVYVANDVRTFVVGDLRIALYVLMGAVALVLLIATANIANLVLARTRARAREIGTRLAIGATPARLARQFLTESMLLSAAAGLVGFLLGVWALGPVVALIPAHYIGEESEIHASPIAFLMSLAVALLLGIILGTVPAVFISRRGVAANLGHTRAAADDRGAGRVRALLVLSEMGLAFVVVTAAGLMVRTYRQLTSMDLGFQPDHVLTMRIPLPESKYPGGPEITGFFQELLPRVRSLPAAVEVAASSVRPMDGVARRDFSIPGRSLNTPRGIATADYRVITPQYFAVIRTPLREGRFFHEQDSRDAPGVAIVNERFTQTYFPGQGAVGKQIRLESEYSGRYAARESDGSPIVQIVGVVADSRQLTQWSAVRELYDPASPEIFVPFLQHPEAGRNMGLLVRTQTDPANLTNAVRQQVLGVDADETLDDIETLRDQADLVLGPSRLCLLLLSIFAGTAIVTACVGLFAIVSYTVIRRTHEIGIRVALGARQHDVLRVVVREALLVAATGLAVGLVASFGVTRIMSSLLYRVASNDFITLTVVSALLAAVAVFASYIPARRATKLDPMVALRYE